MSNCKQQCCESKRSYTDDLFFRSVLLLIVGMLPIIPYVEALLSIGFGTHAYFIFATLTLGYTIYKDHKDLLTYCMALLAFVSAIVFLPQITNVYLVYAIAASLLPSAILLLCTTEKFWLQMGLTEQNNDSEKYALSELFEFPPVQKILFLFVMLNWSMSLSGLITPVSLGCSLAIHDALLVVGFYNLTGWLQHQIRSHVLAHNHMKKVSVFIDGKWSEININGLKSGHVVKIVDDTKMPVASKAQSDCQILKDEKIVDLPEGSVIKAHQTILSGEIVCSEDYKPYQDTLSNNSSDDRNFALNLFLSVSFIAALASGFVHGLAAGSLVIGLQAFSLSTIVTCPCVFLAVNIIMQSKVAEYLSAHTNLNIVRPFALISPDIVVFDRTNTLYLRDEVNPNGDFKLSENGKALIKKLTSKNIQLAILSGHHTEGWADHLEKCKGELGNYIEEELIRFGEQYHGDQSQKSHVIRNLQLYGKMDAPTTFIAKMQRRFEMGFRSNVVAMIGDDVNDSAAMKMADLSLCVSKSEGNIDDHAVGSASFYTEQANLTDFAELVNIVKKVQGPYMSTLATAVATTCALLLMVNNVLPLSWGLILSPTTACMLTFSSCLIFTASAYLFKPELDACCSKCIRSHHFQPTSNFCGDCSDQHSHRTHNGFDPLAWFRVK